MTNDVFSFKSSNQKNIVHGFMWIPDEEPKAILQISHGMTEYIRRYDEFAEYMNQNGILVVGNDHIGHGKSVESEEEWGYFAARNGSGCVVEDLNTVTQMIKELYPDKPYYLLGHSMGSFMARRYLMNYGENLTGAIIMGTGNQPLPALVSGKTLVKVATLLKGERYRSKFIDNMMFGSYNKRIENVRTSRDWLTRDEAIVEWYNQNPACTFLFTLNGFYTLLDTIQYIEKKANIDKIPKQLPILVTSGAEDPVGNYGKSVVTAYHNLRKAGIRNVDLKLYEGCRHEILNETIRASVYEDIAAWILNTNDASQMNN